MEELQQLQAERLNRLLVEQNISQKDLAERIKVSPTSVNHWVNGKVHMNDYNASLIHDAYPQYSAEWLRGYSEYPNEIEAIRANKEKSLERFFDELDCVEGLLKLNGATVTYFSKLSENTDEWTIEFDNGEKYTTTIHSDDFAKITQGERSLILTMEQWRCFRSEIRRYMNMRLDSMFERGGW